MNPDQSNGGVTRASLELLYNISREVASAIDLPIVLQRVLFSSMRTIGAISGTIIVLDDNGTPVESTIIYGTKIHEHTTEQLKETIEKGLAGWVVRNRQAVLIPDTSQDDRWVRRPDDAADASGAKSAVCAPLLARERLIGVLTLVHPTPYFFNLDHLALIQAIADQAGVAVLNARLYRDSQRQAQVMTALAECAAAINSSLKFDDVIETILEQISRALDVELVSLAMLEPDSNTLVYKATTFREKDKLLEKSIKLGEGIPGWVAREGKGIFINQPSIDDRFMPLIDEVTGIQTKAVACSPIQAGEEAIGVLEAINPGDGTFDQDALTILNGIGNLAGTAIRNAQLFEYLEAAQQRYKDLFEQSVDIILITDLDGNIIEANRQSSRLTGHDPNILTNLNITYLHQPNFQILGKSFENLQTEKTLSYESIIIKKNGESIPVQVIIQRIIIDGKPLIQWTFRDITEQKSLDQMRDDLISMVYHDLRAPLSNIISSFEVLSSMLNINQDPAIGSIFNIAYRSAERIQRLTNSLLDINRLEAGQPITEKQIADLSMLVEDAVEAIEPIAKNKNQKIQVQIPENLPFLMIDKDMIRRVLINIIENGIKFTPPGGEISIRAEHEGSWVHVMIEDNGPGVPDDKKIEIFEKYTRLKYEKSTKGLGLGLAYCRLATEGHGGRIWVTDSESGGAVFHFTLPVAELEGDLESS